jgi:serine/threonine-protein kinase
LQPPWAGPEARRLGRYRLGPLLGKGGMGEVYEAWDTLLDRRVALKSLTVPFASALPRFMREAQLQARITHPNVCRVYDVDASGDVPFIAMQLVQGPNLLQAAPDLSTREVVEILHAVAMAINAAHRLDLIHRDIKPSNILLEPDGMGGVNTFVADFGLAKDLAQEPATQTGVPIGTPAYMAPEQLRGDPEALGPAMDVYALGATLRVVLGLARAGSQDGRKDGSGPLERDAPGSATGRSLPRKLRMIIARCMEERPLDRYHSAGELADDLRRYLDGEPLLTQRGTWFRELRRAARAHPALAPSLAMFLALGGGFGAWSIHMTARGRRQADLAQRFALDTRDLQSRMRIERLIPVHDLRPARALMFSRLERIRGDMAALGQKALGPGSLALGRGYAALGELDRARSALETAWDRNYATAEAAYALCRIHCAYCLRLADDTIPGAADRNLAPLREPHLAAARACFAKAGGTGWEPPELGEAALLVQEGAFSAGLAKARQVFRDAPWLYEAKLEEARALTGLGRERLDRDDARAAMSLFREAELAAQVAQAIGQSDEACYLADLAARIQRLGLGGMPLREALTAWTEAERLADKALAIDPDSALALEAKVYVVLHRAMVLAGAGRDPEPDLRRAERYLAPWAESPGLAPKVRLRKCWIQFLRTEHRMARTGGPGRDLGWALEERGGGIWTLEALVLEARWLAHHRQDPGPWLRAFWARQEDDLPGIDRPRLRELQAQARRVQE